MKTNRIAAALIVALLLAFGACAPAMAKVVSPSDEFYYLDEAGVLSEAMEGEIFFSNELLFDACGAQIVVVTLDTTGSEAIDDYTDELFNAWGIGDKAKQNGFLLLLAIEDDDYYAACGTGLQSRFTASALKDYFDKYLESDFAAKRYEAGVKKFFEAVFARVADTYNADVTTAQGIAAYQAWLDGGADPIDPRSGGGGSYGNYGPGGESDEDDYAMLGMIIIVLVIVLIIVVRRRRRRIYSGGTTVMPIFFGGHRTPPSHHGPMNVPGPGGYRGRARPGPGIFGGGYRPPSGGTRPSGGSTRPSSGSSTRPSSGSSFGGLFGGSSGGHSGGGRTSFGSARGGGGGSRGGGAGRGRH